MVKKLVIIPAYNEEQSIVRAVSDVKKCAEDFDVVVINDCSKDRTADLCRSAGAEVIDLPVNMGIGGAMQAGYSYAVKNEYDLAVQVDGDGQHDPSFIHMMYDLLTSENADMVIGSRFIEKKGYQSSFPRRCGIRYFSWLIRMLTGKKITDPTSGFRMVNAAVLKLFAEDYPKDYPEPETLVKLLKKKMKVIEAPVIMRPRRAGRSSISFKWAFYYMVKVTVAVIRQGFSG